MCRAPAGVLAARTIDLALRNFVFSVGAFLASRPKTDACSSVHQQRVPVDAPSRRGGVSLRALVAAVKHAALFARIFGDVGISGSNNLSPRATPPAGVGDLLFPAPGRRRSSSGAQDADTWHMHHPTRTQPPRFCGPISSGATKIYVSAREYLSPKASSHSVQATAVVLSSRVSFSAPLQQREREMNRSGEE